MSLKNNHKMLVMIIFILLIFQLLLLHSTESRQKQIIKSSSKDRVIKFARLGADISFKPDKHVNAGRLVEISALIANTGTAASIQGYIYLEVKGIKGWSPQKRHFLKKLNPSESVNIEGGTFEAFKNYQHGGWEYNHVAVYAYFYCLVEGKFKKFEIGQAHLTVILTKAYTSAKPKLVPPSE